jgi:Family of unknown function (DUF5692)
MSFDSIKPNQAKHRKAAIMLSILAVIAFFLFYVSTQELVRRSHVIWTWGLFAVVPIALSGYWIQINNFDPFLWIKIYTMMFCICWASWMRSKERKPWLQSTISLLLIVNVLEATIVDFWSNGLAHALNAATGAILIFTLPRESRRATGHRQPGYCDLHVNMPRHWIIGYTLWNWTFVYLNYPQWSGHHLALLLAALVIGLIEPKRWIQARACTLGINLLLTATWYEQTLSIFDSKGWYAPQLAIASALVGLTWAAAPLIRNHLGTCAVVAANAISPLRLRSAR